MTMLWVAFFVTLVLASVVLFSFHRVRNFLRLWKIKKQERTYGSFAPAFAVASAGKNVAVCRYQDYDWAHYGSAERPVNAAPWEKVYVFPKKTFLFTEASNLTKVHVGDEEYLRKFAEAMYKRLTGIDVVKYPRKLRERALTLLFKRVPDLFVPYAGGLPGFGPKEMYGYYDEDTRDPQAAIIYLGDTIPK